MPTFVFLCFHFSVSFLTSVKHFWLKLGLLFFASCLPALVGADSAKVWEQAVWEQEAWEQVFDDSEQSITIYKRPLANGYSEFKGIATVQSTLSGCIALMRDVKAMPQWVDRTLQTVVLNRVSETEVYAYNVSRMDWPFKHRDAIVHIFVEQDPRTLAVTIRGSGVPTYSGPSRYDFKKNNNRYIRMPVIESRWQFVPEPDGRVKVIFQGYGDPGGNTSAPIFKWLINRLAWEAPYNTLKAMKTVVQQEKYQRASFDFILDVNNTGIANNNK